MSKPVIYLVCVKWGEQSRAIPSVRKHCCLCEALLAMDAKNDAMAADFRCLCCTCCFEHFADEEVAGGLVGGKLYPTTGQAMLAAIGERNRN